jgi:fluoroacetyl-CoA thioesterase
LKTLFKIGDVKTFERIVDASDLAGFEAGLVHPVYSTFALGRDAEWACRLFVLEMKEENEEGIGTFLTIHHKTPAMLGQKVTFEAEIIKLEGAIIDCKYTASVGERIVATGTQGQMILPKEKISKLFDSVKS